MLKRGTVQVISILLMGAFLAACDLAIEEDAGTTPPNAVLMEPAHPNTPPSAQDDPPPSSQPLAPTPTEASRFLMAASFGPNAESVQELVDLGYSNWIQSQFELPMRSIFEEARPVLAEKEGGSKHLVPISLFYENAIMGEDQLRMRGAFALSQIFVVSSESSMTAYNGLGLSRFADILQEGAFGNFRNLLEEVTYSPVMGEYLTYAGSRKANIVTGVAPDENYAREIMQLFTIGLYELERDGTLRLDAQGQPIETYDNEDITELAKVFTGLWYEGLPYGRQRGRRSEVSTYSRMTMFEEEHSQTSKTFLGATLPATMTGEESISAALDVLFEHPNTAPFLSKQLIQRMTTSNPSPEYVERVATAFETGSYRLPNNAMLGSGDRGDMRAVWAAILMDPEFHAAAAQEQNDFGKVREPVIRWTHWARMANVPSARMLIGNDVLDSMAIKHENPERLGQRPFSAPSVFNFYRPGYSAAGSATAEAGLVAPELQITTATSVINYANFMRSFVFRDEGASSRGRELSLVGDYSAEIDLARDPDALIDRLDWLLTAGTMSSDTRRKLQTVIESVTISASNAEEQLRNRVQLAIQLIVVSPEYIVQQ